MRRLWLSRKGLHSFIIYVKSSLQLNFRLKHGTQMFWAGLSTRGWLDGGNANQPHIFFKASLPPGSQTNSAIPFWPDKFFALFYIWLSKSTWGEHLVEDIPNFTCIFVYVFICATSPGQTNNNTDLIFCTHTGIDLILKGVFCFAEKILVTAASLKKTAMSRGFSAYLLDCLVLYCFIHCLTWRIQYWGVWDSHQYKFIKGWVCEVFVK